MSDWDTWAAGTLTGIGAPLDQTNIDTLFAWSSAETDPFPLMRWENPLDTTQLELGSVSENSARVQWYPSIAEGIQATVTTLLNGHYPGIVAHLRNSVPRSQWGDVCHELDVWGTGCAWISIDYGLAPQELLALTAEQDALLRRIFNLLMLGYHTGGDPTSDGYDLTTILPAVKAIQATVDLTPVLTAIAALSAKVDAVEAKVAKDLA